MSQHRIIIVEDNTLVAEDCRTSLERNGFDVVELVATGEAAIEAAGKHRPDAVLMDIRLSGEMDGIEAAEQIFQQFDVPVLFLSAFSDETLLRRATKTGAFGYLIKPYSESALRAMLETVISKSEAERDFRRALERIYDLEKTESLGRMAGAVAHHYNNKMAVILGGIEIALQDLPPGSHAAETLEMLNQTVQSTIQLGRQMLSCLGETFKPRETLDLADICRQVAETWESGRHANSIAMQSELAPIAHPVWANAEEIGQTLSSIIENAEEAMEGRSGTIYIRLNYTRGARIPDHHRFPQNFMPDDRTYACIEVQDEGCGVSGPDINRLFDPFFTTKFTGRGLGLPVALGLVRSHNGCITVESSVNIGRRFQIWMPVQDDQ